MAAIIQVMNVQATFKRETGLWTSDDVIVARLLNLHTSLREDLGHSTLSHFKENLDYERTIAEYVIEEFGGEIVHVDSYLNQGPHDPNTIY